MHTATVVWNYGTARSVGCWRDGITHCVVRGLVTPRVAQSIMRDNATYLRVTQAGGQLVDYSNATLAFTLDAIERHANEAAVAYAEFFRAPCALIVAPDHFDLLSTYSTLMARHGIARAPFLSSADAHQWLRKKMAVLAEMPRESDPQAGPAAAPSRPHQEPRRTGAQDCEPQR
jgi:hypothetical protein